MTTARLNKNHPQSTDFSGEGVLSAELNLLENSISVFDVNMRKKLKECFWFAAQKHNAQYYTWLNHKRLPYIFHVSNVARNTFCFQKNHLLTIIAFWHDLIEDERCTESELIEKIECLELADDKELIIIALRNLNRKNFTYSKDYYHVVCSDNYSLVVKSADILANLNACLIRFDEMQNDGTIHWIYDYLFEVENFLFVNIDFINNENSLIIKKKLMEIILLIDAKFSVSEKNEFIKFCEERKNGKNL